MPQTDENKRVDGGNQTDGGNPTEASNRSDGCSCKICGATLTADEIALTKKLMGRGVTEFFCLRCLAAYYRCSEELLRRKIKIFKDLGCALFNN